MCAPTRGARPGLGSRLAAGFAAVLPPLSKGGGTSRSAVPEGLPCGGLLFERSAATGGIALQRALRRSGLPRNIKFIRRGGIHPARGVCAAAHPGGMRASRPTNARAVAAIRFGRSFSVVCRGRAMALPGTFRCRRVPRDDASIVPYRGCNNAGAAFFRFAAGFASPRRAGVHARRTAAIPKPECSPRREVRRDEGIPPYGRPCGSHLPARPVIPGRFVGEGHAPPVTPRRRKHPREGHGPPLRTAAGIVPFRFGPKHKIYS